jgi:hypothetical protein
VSDVAVAEGAGGLEAQLGRRFGVGRGWTEGAARLVLRCGAAAAHRAPLGGRRWLGAPTGWRPVAVLRCRAVWRVQVTRLAASCGAGRRRSRGLGRGRCGSPRRLGREHGIAGGGLQGTAQCGGGNGANGDVGGEGEPTRRHIAADGEAGARAGAASSAAS